jgi:hypothetical protein
VCDSTTTRAPGLTTEPIGNQRGTAKRMTSGEDEPGTCPRRIPDRHDHAAVPHGTAGRPGWRVVTRPPGLWTSGRRR